MIKYLLGLIILISSGVFAQNELGNPYIKNYSPKEYNSAATIWDITQDNNGLMYFGTSGGVLQYDGSSWQNISIDNETTVRALDIDKNGVVYVGAKNEFGYIGIDSLKRPIYMSLSKDLAEENQDFTDVWNVYATNEGVFFLTFKRIYRWHNNQIDVYNYDDITAHLGFYVNQHLYLVLLNKGLHVFKKDKFVPVVGGLHYEGKTIYSILPYDDDNIIVATRNEGLEIHNIRTGEILPFKNSVNEEIKNNKVYHGTVSENGELVIATLKKGIYVIDRNGDLVRHINQENGLQNNNVKYVFKDNYGGLWAGTAVGISYIDLNLPLTFFGSENGIAGYTRDVIRYNEQIYIATGNGIYYLDKNELELQKKFKPFKNTDDQFWDFIVVKDHLLVGGSHGFYEIKDNKIKRIKSFNSNAVFSMLQSSSDENRIYLALKNGVAIAEVTENNEVKVVHQFDEYNTESHQMGEDENGNLWIATAFDYLIKIDHTSFDKEKNYPLSYKKIEYGEKLSSEEVINIGGKIYFTSEKGLLSIDKNDKLELDHSFKIENLPAGFIIRRMQEDSKGNLWVHYHHDKLQGQFLALKSEDGTYKIKEAPFTRINEKISHVSSPYIENSGIIWFPGGEGLVRYDYNKDVNERKRYNVNIRKVVLHTDSIISYGNNKESNLDNFTFLFRDNATSFTFSAASYGNEKENKYQYFLEGYDEDWSEWTSLSHKEYNYLPEDEYVFRVRAKNIYNQISKEDQFTFIVLPPWYRETWAYFMYAFAFIVLLYLIIKLATYRLLQSKKHLEEIVVSRTKDITIEKEKVENQKLELEDIHKELSERNKDVMDSIKYAQRIQTSILPPLDIFKSEFKNSFILYKPRDIVSGDFYWFDKVEDYFIMACADCTGHGVPGAFMSMIGATLISKIVEKEEMKSCEQALTELDKEMQKALRQNVDDDDHTSVDGMDLALIAVNLKEGVCHYSGAYRPLYFIRDNELTVYNSNRISVGGGFGKDKTFTGVTIDLKSGDQIYMFTDGYTDQFGGEKNKKFKRDRLKKLLLDHCKETMNIQSQKIEQAFNNWRGDNEQIDDVLLVGIQIP
ncbi:MAG: SpoIIE family protein phosphatase [Flavobacteriales bacterium]|nr:SpoIIE family protein phosphatase [Flavobacteriales bacterium]